MNKENRGELKRALRLVEEAAVIVRRVSGAEADRLENTPENFTNRIEVFESSTERLEECVSTAEELIASITEVIEN